MTQRRYSSCSYCGGSVDEQLVRVETWIGDQLVVFHDVPAGVCDSCGEEYFGADIQDKMFELAKTPPKKTLDVPVYGFSDVLTVAKAEARRKKKERQQAVEDDDEPGSFATDDEISALLHTSFEEWDDQ